MSGIVADDLNLGAMLDSFPHLSPSWILTLAFVLALIAGAILKVWLTIRQIRHVTLHRSKVPPAFSLATTLTTHQKAADYTIAKAHIGLLESGLGWAALLAWTLLGGLSAINLTLVKWLGGGMGQQIALLAIFIFINGLIDLPLNLYQTFVIEERFGFNKTTIKLWLIDLVKSCVIGTILGLPIAALILWLMGAAGNQWWLWTWGAWMGFNLLLLLVYPSLIAPMFNKFAPLEDETLKARVTALMQRCGFAAKGFFVMDGSKRSAHANAYFTGFGAAKRVVFYDTLLAKLSADEVDAVLAHELGHFKHRHIIKRIISMAIVSLLGFALLGWLGTQIWFYHGLGVEPNSDVPNDALALLLFMLVVPVFSSFFAPVFAAFSRKHEFEADAYAVRQTSGADLTTALLKLYQDNASTLTPDPLYVKFYYSHPTASERLSRMMD
jgi:STE24 endopeptidase